MFMATGTFSEKTALDLLPLFRGAKVELITIVKLKNMMILSLNKGGRILLVKCISQKGYLHEPNMVKDGYTDLTDYNEISKDTCYLVYGIIHYGGGFRYLLFDDFEMTYWYPAELFEIVDSSTPANWYFKFYEHDADAVSAVWGYKELLSPSHIDGLGELEDKHVQIFLKAKDETYKNLETTGGNNRGDGSCGRKRTVALNLLLFTSLVKKIWCRPPLI
ncbi:hypothetical protein ACM26V_15530 [Salipaludibacillus sp. HK11]|uniref:hypothetical protein n=1 Tax=Salipaludibacillus sp. HK11 TaxID=3394320 RepID=UPI0039FD2534